MEKFGLFVEVLPGKQGLVHSSELDVDRGVQLDSFSAGDTVDVKLLEVCMHVGNPPPPRSPHDTCHALRFPCCAGVYRGLAGMRLCC